MVEFITTQKVKEFIHSLTQLEHKHFGDHAFNETQVLKWWEARRFFYAGAYSAEKKEMRSSMSMLLIDETNFKKLQGGMHERDLEPYHLGSRAVGYLYLGGLIVGDKHDTPFLCHRIAKDVVTCAQTEDIPIKYCFSVPTSQKVERLLRRMGFENDGRYLNKFPIYKAPTVGAQVWQAFLCEAANGEPLK